MAKTAKQAKLSAGQTLSAANNGFAAEIYQALLPDQSSDNLIFSPYSLHSVLGMVSQGARGETRTELIKGLKFNEEETDKAIRSAFSYIITDLNEGDEEEEEEKDKEEDDEDKEDSDGDDYQPYVLRTANRVFSRTGFKLNKTFVKVVKSDFLADFEQLDLTSRPKCAEAAGRINRWVAAKTKNKITNLVDAGSLDPSSTSLVLVNCIYFKGIWSVQFQPMNTCNNADFHVTPTKKVKVAMMRQTSNGFAYGELPELDAHVVDMAYQGGKMSMRIILPKAVDGLARIQDGLGTLRQNGRNLIVEAMSKFSKEYNYKVDLELPKFKIEATIGNLRDALEDNLGMKAMFSEADADFGGIPDGVNDPPLHISQVIQKAYISVNEEGTEAAAATQGGPLRGSDGRKYKHVDFCVDRPFYFEIVDDENDDLVLFSGHVIDPSK